MTLETCVIWLKSASWVLIGFGLAMFLATFTPVAMVFDLFLDLAFLSGSAGIDTPTSWLLAAISGGLLTGFGVMTLFVAERVYPSDPDSGRVIIGAGILSWFLIDSAGSILVGVWFNAVLNLSFLALFAIPLLAQRSDVSRLAQPKA